MRSFFVHAILGIAGVQAITAESMVQTEARISKKVIKAGQELFVRCTPFNKNFDNALHKKSTVSIDGLQTATAKNKTDDPVNFIIGVRNLGLPNNSIRVRIWQPSDAVKKKTVKKAKNCKIPSPEPAYFAD